MKTTISKFQSSLLATINTIFIFVVIHIKHLAANLRSIRPLSVLKTLLLSLLATLLIINPTNAISEELLDYYNLNGIYYYNPQGGGATCYSGNLSGDTSMAKIVSYLKGNNPTGFVLSDNGIAGILANFKAESAFNPFRFQSDRLSGPAYGVAQFDPMEKILTHLRSDPRTATYYNTYFDLKYTHYDPNTGLPKEPVPMEVVDAWLAVQLDYFFGPDSEFENTRVGEFRNKGGVMGLDYISSSMTAHEAMDAAKTAEDAARIFVWIMERPADKKGDAEDRSASAQEQLNYVQSLSASGDRTTSVSTTANGSQVTIIGDSITQASINQLNQKLPGVDIHASNNLDGAAILHNLIDNNQLRTTLVYALGTDRSFTSDEIQEIVNLAGKSRKVIFVNNWSLNDDFTANNNALTKVKNDNSNVKIVDWKTAIEGQEATYLEPDGTHPNEAGQELFAQMIASTVNASGSTLSACASVGLIEGGMDKTQAQKLADYYNGSEVDASYWNLPFGKENCVSFTAFFVQRFTSIGRQTGRKWGNGRNTAHWLARDKGLPEGTEPRPYAVFSTTYSTAGHTGIVVNVDGDTITTIEAAYGYGQKGHDARVTTRDISYFKNTDYTNIFTYLDSVLDQAALAEVIGS